MDTTRKRNEEKRFFLIGICLLLIVQGVARFAVQPAVGFVLDDWSYWAQAEKFPSASATLVGGLRNPLRPFLHVVQLGAHRVLEDNLVGFATLVTAAYSLALVFFVLFVRELTGKTAPALAAGLLFALLPNLCGHFHWLCIAWGMEFAGLMGILSAWGMVRHIRRGEGWALGISVLGYFLSIGTYEIAIFLPGAYGVLLWGRGWKKWLLTMIPFGVAFATYVAWRLTFAFGWGWSWFGIPPQTNVAISLWDLKHTLADIVSWWGGLKWWQAVADGAEGFAELKWTSATLLVAINVALLAGLASVLTKTERKMTDCSAQNITMPLTTAQLFLFGLVWLAATYLPAILGYLEPRVNYLPGAGLAFLAALALGNIRLDRWLVALLMLAFAGMVVSEGDTKNWADSIRFQKNLFDSMSECQQDWKNAEVLWLDTRELSQRMTPGILGANRHHIDTIDEYRNAGLLRAFAPSDMAELILKGQPGPQVVLDVEYGAHEENGILKWHERYNPEKPMETPIDKVYRMDVFAAGIRKNADVHD